MSDASPLNIIYMGTPDFAVPGLQALIDSDHNVIAVYTQPPRPKGRGQKIIKSPIHQLADAHDIPVFTPKKLKKNDEGIAEFKTLVSDKGADIAVVAAYGLILPKDVLDAPKYGCLNIHASLLPRWRGASPIQQAIWADDKTSGVTIMQMDEGLDTGDMLKTVSCEITKDMTSSDLHDILSDLGATAALDVIHQISTGNAPTPTPQDNNATTYAPLLKKEDGLIDWTQSAQDIDRQIRALNPWPGVITLDRYGDSKNRHKILKATPLSEHFGQPPGRLVNKRGHVACGNDTGLRIDLIQPAGANKPMDMLSAINGGYISVGHAFKV